MDAMNLWLSIAASAVAIIGGIAGFVMWSSAQRKRRTERALNDGDDHWLSLQRSDKILTQMVIPAEAGSETEARCERLVKRGKMTRKGNEMYGVPR